MELLPKEMQDLAILRRILFTVSYLPKGLPNYWTVVCEFAGKALSQPNSLKPNAVQIAVENLKFASKVMMKHGESI